MNENEPIFPSKQMCLDSANAVTGERSADTGLNVAPCPVCSTPFVLRPGPRGIRYYCACDNKTQR